MEEENDEPRARRLSLQVKHQQTEEELQHELVRTMDSVKWGETLLDQILIYNI